MYGPDRSRRQGIPILIKKQGTDHSPIHSCPTYTPLMPLIHIHPERELSVASSHTLFFICLFIFFFLFIFSLVLLILFRFSLLSSLPFSFALLCRPIVFSSSLASSCLCRSEQRESEAFWLRKMLVSTFFFFLIFLSGDCPSSLLFFPSQQIPVSIDVRHLSFLPGSQTFGHSSSASSGFLCWVICLYEFLYCSLKYWHWFVWLFSIHQWFWWNSLVMLKLGFSDSYISPIISSPL